MKKLNFTEVGRFIYLFLVIWCGFSSASGEPKPRNLSVMTWNIWGKLNQDPRYTIDGLTARQRMIEILQTSKADIIAMIETYGSAQDIADDLGFYYYTPGGGANLSIFSRYKLTHVGTPQGLSSFSFIGATANLSQTTKIRIYCIWLTSGGRHIVEIKNKELSDEDFVSGDNVRSQMIHKFLNHQEVKADMERFETTPIIVAGDFNCVSRLDYSDSAESLNYGRILEATPTHDIMIQKGFVDAFRKVHPKITKKTLGHTWTTVGEDFIYKSGKGFVALNGEKNPSPEYRNPYARIDFIYAKGNLLPQKASVIKNFRNHHNRNFPEFPSDHAAVLVSFEVKPTGWDSGSP